MSMCPNLPANTSIMLVVFLPFTTTLMTIQVQPKCCSQRYCWDLRDTRGWYQQCLLFAFASVRLAGGVGILIAKQINNYNWMEGSVGWWFLQKVFFSHTIERCWAVCAEYIAPINKFHIAVCTTLMLCNMIQQSPSLYIVTDLFSYNVIGQ